MVYFDTSMAANATRPVPPHVRQLNLGERIRWARKTAGLSHDRLVERIGRSNRGHLIKIEQGVHTPGRDLRAQIADACGVPRDLFDDEDDDEGSDADQSLFRALKAEIRRAIREEIHP